MAQEKHHYIQPTGPRDAMELIQKLFNKYRNAELTSELLSYHQNLLMRLGDDILRAAQAEHNPQLMQDLKSMTAIHIPFHRTSAVVCSLDIFSDARLKAALKP